MSRCWAFGRGRRLDGTFRSAVQQATPAATAYHLNYASAGGKDLVEEERTRRRRPVRASEKNGGRSGSSREGSSGSAFDACSVIWPLPPLPAGSRTIWAEYENKDHSGKSEVGKTTVVMSEESEKGGAVRAASSRAEETKARI